MTTPPGWCDAGSPGRVRWWDGRAWTAHEIEATPTGAAAPGWYENRLGAVRWWDGRQWTGCRVRGGDPGIDLWMTEPPALAWTMGAVFLTLGLLQLPLVSHLPLTAALFLVLGALWISSAIPSSRVRRLPAPTVPPVALAATRPLPGEVEAAGAGWYALSASTSRWWTGSRWAAYTVTHAGLRPTFHAAYVRRVLGVVSLVLIVVAAAAIVAGSAIVVIASRGAGGPVEVSIGWVLVACGALLAGVGALLVALTRFQVRMLVLPSEPPRTPTADGS